MTKPKYYFSNEDSEMCYPLKTHKSEAIEDGLTEIELFEAVPEKITGMFWCRAVQDVSEEGYCGKQCIDYEPKNGKSGMCKHKSNKFYEPGKKVIFKIF